jgi:hypothetical protein
VTGAEKHGRQRDRELVDQAGVHVLQDRRAAARDADVPVAGDLAALVERGLDAVVDEVEGGPARPLLGVTLLVRHDEDRGVEGRLLRPRLLAGVEHALAHHARAGALERLPRDVGVAPFLAARPAAAVRPARRRTALTAAGVIA